MGDKKEISDIITAAERYLSRLQSLNIEIANAQQQIISTSSETEHRIEIVFDALIKDITQVLNCRRNELLKKVESTKTQSLKPLTECQTDITTKIQETTKLINEGKSFRNGVVNGNEIDLVDEFNKKSSWLGSLPVIPELKEVPYLTLQYENSSMNELKEISKTFGSVSQIAPVQISECSEKPGAILVEWQGVDDGGSTDVQEFRLQKAFGDVTKENHLFSNFKDCYRGLGSQFLVKDLLPHHPYAFRVCCKFEGSSEWSPWSIPQVSSTSIASFSWCENKDYILANENKIAVPITSSPSLLLSNGPQFHVGYSVEFTYLEFNPKESVTLGLILLRDSDVQTLDNIKSDHHNYIAFDSNGKICVDGVYKSTKLPEVIKGLKVCFSCEAISDGKVRVNVDSCDKIVTYDWHISKDSQLYFAAQFQSTSCKIMVE